MTGQAGTMAVRVRQREGGREKEERGVRESELMKERGRKKEKELAEEREKHRQRS